MIGMVFEIVSGFGMKKDNQAPPIDRKPRYKAAENLRFEGELTTPHWMRTDGLLMDAAHLDIELSTCRVAQILCLIERFGIKINMGMVAPDLSHHPFPSQIGGSYPNPPLQICHSGFATRLIRMMWQL